MKSEDKSFKFVLLLCWIFPVFGPVVIYAFQPKFLSERSRFVVWQLLNKQVSMSLLYYAVFAGLIRVISTGSNQDIVLRSLAFLVVTFICSMLWQLRYTLKWIKGEYVEYKYILKLFSKW